MKTKIMSIVSMSLLTFSGWALAASGTMKITNDTGGKLTVIVTHFGCAGVVDGVATACSELPGGHKGYVENMSHEKKDDKNEHEFIFKNVGMSTGYGVVGKDTSTNQTYTCNSSINAKITFYHNSGGKLTCKF